MSRARGLLENVCGRLGIGIGDGRALISCSRSFALDFLLLDFLRVASAVLSFRFGRRVGTSALMGITEKLFSGCRLVWDAVLACSKMAGDGAASGFCSSARGGREDGPASGACGILEIGTSSSSGFPGVMAVSRGGDLRADFSGTGGFGSGGVRGGLGGGFDFRNREVFLVDSVKGEVVSGLFLVDTRVAVLLPSFSCSFSAFFFLRLKGQNAMPSGGGCGRVLCPPDPRLPRRQHRSRDDSVREHQSKEEDNKALRGMTKAMRQAIEGRV